MPLEEDRNDFEYGGCSEYGSYCYPMNTLLYTFS